MSEPCPKCGSEHTRLGSSAAKHLFRGLVGTYKRFCLGCGKRWRSPVRTAAAPVQRAATLAAAAAVLFGAHAVFSARRQPALDVSASPYADFYREADASGAPPPPALLPDVASPIHLKDASPGPLGGAPPGAYGDPGPRAGERRQWQRGDPAATPAGDPGARSGAQGAGRFEAMPWLSAIKSFFGGSARPARGQVEAALREDKHVLWDKYGKYFSSKDEAKRFYEQAQRNKGAYGN